ncbi:MAG TPA: nuclear transport factor 2 family protein [Longimicrobiales bacterium]|nr:nuclear transport factor 2 family protein [Longimicrobiales bacterium]
MRRLPIHLVLLALVTACSPTPDGPSDTSGELGPEEQVVRAALEQYYADFSARDWDAFASHFHEGATMSTVWMPAPEATPALQISTIPEFVEQAPDGPGSQPIFEERMTDVDIRVSGDLATAWSRYDARFGSPDELMEWSGIDAFTLIRHAGRWRIVSLAYVSDE